MQTGAFGERSREPGPPRAAGRWAQGGVFVGGGICSRLMPRLAELVAAGFAEEDGTGGMLARIPVHLGAAGSLMRARRALVARPSAKPRQLKSRASVVGLSASPRD